MKVIRSIKVICLIFSAVWFAQCGDTYGDFLNDPDNAGVAQWATPVKSATSDSQFNAVAVDNEGNAYAVGYVFKYEEFDFGGNNRNFSNRGMLNNAVLVKYNSSGEAQWATSVETSELSCSCFFNGVAVDGSGNIYAVGAIEGDEDKYKFSFGGISDPVFRKFTGNNSVIVKYDSNGVAQWARTVEEAGGQSLFSGVAVDTSGNSYAVGYVMGGAYNFGGINSAITCSNGTNNAVIVKYNDAGIAQWAKCVNGGVSAASEYKGVAADRSGNVYAVGTINDDSDFSFGNNISEKGYYAGFNTVIVKYNTDGIAQWATPIKSGSDASVFNGVAVDRSGNAYAAGYVLYQGEYSFGGVSVPFSCEGGPRNAIIVKYNSLGISQWATPIRESSGTSEFMSVAVDVVGSLYAAGYVEKGSFDFGGITNSFNMESALQNTVIVKYNSAGVAQWATPIKETTPRSQFNGVAVDRFGYTYAVGTTGKFGEDSGSCNFGGKSMPFNNQPGVLNTVIVKYY